MATDSLNTALEDLGQAIQKRREQESTEAPVQPSTVEPDNDPQSEDE